MCHYIYHIKTVGTTTKLRGIDYIDYSEACEKI